MVLQSHQEKNMDTKPETKPADLTLEQVKAYEKEIAESASGENLVDYPHSERLWNAVWLTLRAQVLAGSAYRRYKRIS